jgi:PD-(D/E)XK endonuclease
MHKATSLGFPLALPYGHLHRYDFIVESGRNLWRVQVKTSTFLVRGFYRLCVYNYNSLAAYAESEIDFVAVLVIPEDTWYILPVREVLERRTLFFRPTGDPRVDHYAHYREAWHLLREPDGLTFG